MGLAINIILLGIAFIALSISGGFSTDSARRVTNINGYSTNDKLTKGHSFLTISAIITWITVALIILGIILMIFFLPEETEASAVTGGSYGKYFIYGLLFLTLGAVIAVGILSAIAANDIGNSGVSDDNLSRRQAIIAASIAIGVFVLLLIGLILVFTYKPKKKETMIAGINAPNWAVEDVEDSFPDILKF